MKWNGIESFHCFSLSFLHPFHLAQKALQSEEKEEKKNSQYGN